MKLPSGLPVHNPTQSYWQSPPLGIANERTTPYVPSSARYVIVGSGITGALTAFKLLQHDPEADIVMLEARQACSGATGRNGGHCRAGRYLSFAKDVENYGVVEALRLEALEVASVHGIARLVDKEHIKCDLRAVETCDIWTDQSKWEEAVRSVKVRESMAKEFPLISKHKIWERGQARNEFLVPEAYGAISFPAYALSPYKLVCALLHLSLAKGLNLQTTTPVVRIRRQKSLDNQHHWSLLTPRGTIVAEKVILATNAYTGALYPEIASFLTPTRGQIAAVRPGSKIISNPALRRTCGLNNSITDDYFQRRGDGLSGEGDLIIGGGRKLAEGGEEGITDDSVINPKISHYLTTALADYFGRENWGEDGTVLQEWTGIMGYTKDNQPAIGEAPGKPGLFVCAGFNGHGMALAYRSVEATVDLIRGNAERVDAWLPRSYRLSRVQEADC